jgi:hypothetical protein
VSKEFILDPTALASAITMSCIRLRMKKLKRQELIELILIEAILRE